MSNKGEIHCPLRMEKMDLTDQHLKPCKCGYEVCVWCWHHIIEMAEKDDTEGRCPACRSPYDKKRILGRTISSERLAALNSAKKQKLQKAKLKTSEVRSDLTTARVIKRNLVYVAGLPSIIADEETLRKKEFLGQYGKITKIVIARNVGSHRLFPSFSTSVVYVTFSKQQEAFCCIEAVNGFVLDGRPLKACFGTTRYCHAWLKNMTVYLHDAGPQDDICAKDEVASACLSKLPQNSGNALHNFEQRSGSVLPPPRDFCSSNSSVAKGKFLVQSVDYTPIDNGKRHFQNGDSGNSDVLPVAASWGSRLASGMSSYAGVAFSQGTIDHPSIPTRSLAGVDMLLQNAFQTQRQMIMSRNQMPLSNGCLENIASLEPYVENGFREDMVAPNFKSSNYTKIMANNTESGSSCVTYREDMKSRITQSSHLSDSVGFGQQPYVSFSDDIKCLTTVETSKASSCVPRLSNGTIWDSGFLYSITEEDFFPAAYPVTSSIEDNSVSNLQASPVSRSEVLPPSEFPAGIRSIRPGFHPRHVDDQNQAFSKLTNFGSIAQYQISGNSPCINSSQENITYNSFNDPQINQINGSKTASLCKGKVSQSMIRQFSLSSNSISLAGADQRLQFQARLGNLTQNPVSLMKQSKNMTLQHMENNNEGAWGSCNIGQSALAEIIHRLIPGSKKGSCRLCEEHEKPCFQVPDSSRLLFNIQDEQS